MRGTIDVTGVPKPAARHPRRKPVTPRSRVRSALRRLWLTSRERAEALKLAHYTCRGCGAKQSRAAGREVFVEVHHQNMVENWEKLIDMVYESLLCKPDDLIVLCHDCHDKVHNEDGGPTGEM